MTLLASYTVDYSARI